MGAVEYALAFSIAGKVAGSFTGAAQKASKAISQLGSNLAEMNASAGKMEHLISLQQTNERLTASVDQQRAAVLAMNRSILVSKKPTAQQIALQKQLQQQYESTKASLRSNTAQLNAASSAMEQAGISLSGLNERYRKLAAVLKRANRLQDIQNSLQEHSRKSKEIASEAFSGAMGSLAKMSATYGLFAKKAMDMEDAMADVRKVVDFPEPKGVEKLQKALQEMSLTIPMSSTGLAQIAAAAGQSGIAAGELKEFTEQAAKMGVAFDISAAEAGEMMAKWQSAMGLTQAQTVELADASNALSNANAAQAKQIGDVLLRYGALGQVAGLSAKQTAAFAATAISAGAEAEVAATGINSFMRAMVKGGGMSDLQKAAFVNVGFDPTQLQKDVQKNAPKAILEVLDGIKTKIPKELQSQYLTAMFGEEGARAMGPMIVNTEQLRKNFELVANAEKYAGSMESEFLSRSNTTSNSVQLLSNTAEYLAQVLGGPLLEPIRTLCSWGVKLGKSFADFLQNNQELTTAVVQYVATGAAVSTGLLFLKAAFFVARAGVLSFASSLVGIVKTMMLLPGLAKSVVVMYGTKLVAAIKAVGVALRFLCANPMGIAITAVAALIAAGVLLYKNWDTVKAYLLQAWESIKTAFVSAWESMKATMASFWDGMVAAVKTPINAIIGMINAVISGINQVMSFKVPEGVPMLGGKSFGVNIPQVPALAEGGVVSGPTLAMVGEGRESEAVMPLSRLSDFIGSGSGASSLSVNFAPVINITGNSGAYDDVSRGLNEGRKTLMRDLERLMADQRRRSFA